MNILHFILGKANPDRANGVNQVIYGMAKYQSRAGHTVHVVGISKPMKMPYEIVDRGYFKVECFQRFNKAGFNRIKELAKEVDLVHLHGVWNSYNIKVGRYLESISKPYIVTAHCGYAVDRLKQSNYWLKLLYHKLWQKRLYEKAAGIHALTREEATDIDRYCKNDNIFVVPNGVDPETYDQYSYKVHSDRDKVHFGYLGRLTVEKNIINLIRSFALLPEDYRKNVELYLIGPLSSSTKQFKLLVEQLGLQDIVKFHGGKYGQEKIEALLDLDVYMHPAYSDVVGISVMEALALGIPTIATRTSHMSYFNTTGAFVMVEPTASDLGRGVREMIDNKNNWQNYSEKAKNLYSQIFNWKIAVSSLERECSSLIHKK